jgi:hypothetical protein
MSFSRGLAGVACALLAVTMVSGDEKVRVEGLLDAEYWNTDGGSYVTGKNEDDPGAVGRLRLSALGEFLPGFQGFARGVVEGGEATMDGTTEVDLEQAFVRYTFQQHPLVIDAGKIVTPIGNFSRRYLSSDNPLISEPLNYSVSYPVGIAVSGRSGPFDYMAAVLDSPMVNESWVPESSAAPRPAIAAGLTPVVGTRIGVFATAGPYLGEGIEEFLASDESWKDFDQTVYGLDVRFSRGYFELNGELAWSTYDVPGGVGESDGVAWFIEPKFTFTPRIFASMRYEWNDYPYIPSPDPSYPIWFAASTRVAVIEVGLGYRIANGLIVKSAYRQDHEYGSDAPDGQSIALQFSYGFDVGSWFRRPL